MLGIKVYDGKEVLWWEGGFMLGMRFYAENEG